MAKQWYIHKDYGHGKLRDRAKRKYHIATDTGTLCKQENDKQNWNPLLWMVTEDPPADRQMCGICTHKLAQTKKAKPKNKKRRGGKGGIYQSGS
jgi:hypothetical protein